MVIYAEKTFITEIYVKTKIWWVHLACSSQNQTLLTFYYQKSTFVLPTTTRRCMCMNRSVFYKSLLQQFRKQLRIKALSHSLFKCHSQYAFNMKKVVLQHKISPYRLPATLKADPSITFQSWGLKDFIHSQKTIAPSNWRAAKFIRLSQVERHKTSQASVCIWQLLT